MSEVKPVRIQRSRQHKQISPNSLPIVYVGRPTKCGNPYKVVGQEGHWFVFDTEINSAILTFDNKDSALDCCLELYKEYISHKHNSSKINLDELKGKNLSCWCSLNDKCHIDVLLKLISEL